MRLTFDEAERPLLLARLRLPESATDADLAAAFEREFNEYQHKDQPAAARPASGRAAAPAADPWGRPLPFGRDQYSTINNYSDSSGSAA